jgi:hypothetical protein
VTWHQRGVQARIATVLGISEATVSRNIRATLYAPNLCRECGGYKPRQFQFMKAENKSATL